MNTENWLDGRWTGAGGKDRFCPELRLATGKSRTSWPRSGQAEVSMAVEALGEYGLAWGRLTRSERKQRLRAVLDHWQNDVGGVDGLAQELGLRPGDLDDELQFALETGDRWLDVRHRAGSQQAVLVQISAAQMYAGLVAAVLPALLDGAPVLILSDPDLPRVATEFVWQFSADELLGDALALLHDDRSSCLPCAMKTGFFERAVLSEQSELASIAREGALSIAWQPNQNSAFAVLEDMDPVRAARQVWRGAFDPVRALSGQRHGQIGRVYCHEKRFSAFTQSLLECIDREGDASRCALFSRDLFFHVDQLCGLGLDEGATLLRGGPGEGAGFRASRQKAILHPSVLTNVEPTMGPVRATRPAPVLAIVRAQNDGEALAARDRNQDSDSP